MIPKFRVWDNSRKKMYEVHAVWPTANTITLIEDDGIGMYDMNVVEGVELMQSTGLTDSKGVLIFEGDVLESSNKNWLVQMVWLENKAQFVQQLIKYPEPYECPKIDEIQKLEIIGNMHESPELLGESK